MTTLTSCSKKMCAITALLLLLGGCEKPESAMKYALVGGAIGAGTGIVAVAATSGCIPCAAALGAAVGAGLGLCFDILENKR
ncbi:MAG: hypothetical protein PHD48_06520 [Alphaproteobacteria bacterium]|nr:hypothetical protein [Alphaproteobacteria bacterium]